MLNTLRRGAGSWLAKLLFILLVISFAAWGIGDFLGPNVDTAVATVGDTEISDQEYNAAFNREMERLRQRFGGQIDRETAIGLGLADQVLSRLVSQRLLALEAEDLGIRIGDDLVRRSILEEEAFQNATGEFDRERFEQLLFASGLTEEAYVQSLRGDIARGQVANAVTGGGTAPEDIAQALFKYRSEGRVADLIYLPLTSVVDVPEPEQGDTTAYYEENKMDFEKPEYREITAIVLTPEDVAEKIDVPEDRVREAYEARIREFEEPERRRVTQLLFGEEEAARAAAERLSTGASFEAVAAEATESGAEQTEIGEVQRGELFPKAIEDAAFALQQPGVTEPVRSPLGWHILHVSDIVPGSTRPLEEVAPQISQDIGREIAVERIYEIGNQLQDELASGSTLEEVAQRLDLRLVEIPAVDRQGLAPDGSPVTGMPNSGEFLTEAFSTASGQQSLLEETPDGGYYVLRVDSVTPPTVPPLDQIRDEVEMAWRSQKIVELADEVAKEIATDIEGGEAFEAVARESALQHRTSSPFTRNVNRPEDWLPASLVSRLFEATPDEVIVQRAGDGFYIGRVTEIREADPATATEEIAELQQQLDQSVTADLETQYGQALRERFGVEVDEQVLRRLLM